MLLHGVGTDTQPVSCLLIGEMLEIAEAENRAGGFLQFPRYLLRLLQPTVFGIFDDREKMEAAAEVLRESRLAKTVFATEVTKAGGNTNDK